MAFLLTLLCVVTQSTPLWGASQPSTRPSASAPPSKVLHLRIRGDLDCMKIARDLAAELDRARAENFGFLLLELDGNAWRADVVWAMAQQVRSCGIPAAVWLHDPTSPTPSTPTTSRGDRRVGTGQAVFGLLATTPPPRPDEDAPQRPGVFLMPKLVIGLEPGEDLRASAPEDTDWESVDRELQGAAWLALRIRGVDTELAATLIAPTTDVWAVPDAATGRSRLTIRRPDPTTARDATLVAECSPAFPTPRVRIAGDLAAEFGFASGTAQAPGEVLSAVGIGVHSRTVRELSSGLAKARQDVTRALTDIEAAALRADRILRDLPRPSEPDYASKRTRAGRNAIPIIDEAAATLLRAETLLGDYPELLRETPPSRTPVGQDPGSMRTVWRSLFQQRRDELTRLSARARDYAGR